MDEAERLIYTHHTGRAAPPSASVRQVYAICERRAGKTRIAALVAVFVALRRDYAQLLAPGEQAGVLRLNICRPAKRPPQPLHPHDRAMRSLTSRCAPAANMCTPVSRRTRAAAITWALSDGLKLNIGSSMSVGSLAARKTFPT
jgi:hypothetical protein